ncbi:MAG: ABC transporter ATP-binding protein [Armatimonadota bacterium]
MSEAFTSVLQMVDVSKQFRRGGDPPFTALTDINVTVEDRSGCGEFVCLVGPSGCGKSTLLQLIAGFDTHMPPTTGEMHFRGEPITGPGADRGMLFQDYGCYPHLSVLGNISFGLELHARRLKLSKGDLRDIAYTWLQKVRLREEDADKYPDELSGGMRQRVALARCLALKPRCLLMDEPFSALDEPTRFGMQDLIVSLWAEIEATIVLVSHSIAEAVYLGDRVWVMSGAPGTIVAEFTDMPVPDKSVPAMVAQSTPHFAECVVEVSKAFRKVLATPREALRPIHADGTGQGQGGEVHA